MPIREPQYTMRFVPKGLVDALDATEKFMGACTALTNLVFDQLNPEIVVSRPGVGDPLTEFPGFVAPGVVSVQICVGDTVYGMIASGLNAGKDQPFAYDHVGDTFVAIAGITNGNSPSTPGASGAWEPPTMAVVGTNLYVTHPGFSGSNRFGVIDITNPAAPTWTATDTTTNGLSARPQAVANFFNRAYFAVGNHLEYTDNLSIVRTSSSQALTLGDTSEITVLSGLPVQTISGGILQALIAFKASQIWMVTGDPVFSNLSQNYVSLTLGTTFPRTVVPTPRGVCFSSTAGPYVLDPGGAIRGLVNSPQDDLPDIVAPFQNCTEPTRACAAYSNSIYRVCLDTVIQGVAGRNDYWFDEFRRRWSGPHSFSYDCASQHDNHFVLSSNAAPGKLFHSFVRPQISSVYHDDGTQVRSTAQSSAFPKTGRMNMNQVVESTQELSSGGADTTFTIQALNEPLEQLSVTQIPIDGGGPIWGSFLWGDGSLWSSASNRPLTYTIDWDIPLVFKKMVLNISAVSNGATAIGAFFARYQDAGYLNQGLTPGILDVLSTENDVVIRV
jgi:hypothetical protein